MNRKIAYLVNIYPKLSETFVQREIENLRKLGYDIHVFAIRRKSAIKESFKVKHDNLNTYYAFPEKLLAGIFYNFYYLIKNPVRYFKCVRLISGCLRNSSIPGVTKEFLLFFISSVFLQKLKRENIKYIHAHFSYACSIAMYCHIFSPDIKFGFTAHASADIFYNTVLLEEKIKYSDYIISISNYNKSYLNLITDFIYSNKIYVVHNGVYIGDLCEKILTQDKMIKLICVADFVYCKGHITLLEALSILKDKGYGFILTLIGSGKQETFIRNYTNYLNLSEHIQFLGPQNNPEVLKYIAGCDIFILPSEVYLHGKRDGIPTVCIEAMSMGVPVISTYISGIPELIENGKTGLLVPERNPIKLSDAIIELIDKPDLCKEIARNGYRFVKEKFNIEKTIREIDKIFSEKYFNEK